MIRSFYAHLALLSAACAVLPASAHTQPGRVPLRRLNRREYANAVRDLIGLDLTYPTRRFQSDGQR